MSRRVIAVLDWRAAASLKENVRFVHHAGAAGRVRPRRAELFPAKYRSLIVFEDGSCELQGFSTAAVARRLGGSIVRKKARKARMVDRG